MRLKAIKARLATKPLHRLRDRLAALEALREASDPWDFHEREHIALMLEAYTDAVLHELARREQGTAYEPYPHPMGEGPLATTGETE